MSLLAVVPCCGGCSRAVRVPCWRAARRPMSQPRADLTDRKHAWGFPHAASGAAAGEGRRGYCSNRGYRAG
eukprot:11569896-Alexandrium_andersonii.AAC.1